MNILKLKELSAEIYSGAVSDVLDIMGFEGAVDPALKPISPDRSIIGYARTLKFRVENELKAPTMLFKFIDSCGPGDVLVLGNEGRLDFSCWGELLSTASLKQGIEATVIDGATRDAEEIKRMGYQVYCRGVAPKGPRGRVIPVDTDCPVNIGGIEVKPGDVIYGDEDGLITIPDGKVEDVLNNSREYAQKERLVRKDLENGLKMTEASRWKESLSFKRT